MRERGVHWKMAKLAATQPKEPIRPHSGTGVRRDPHFPGYRGIRSASRTLLFLGEVGESLKTAQAIVGHSDLETTLLEPRPGSLRCLSMTHRSEGVVGILPYAIESSTSSPTRTCHPHAAWLPARQKENAFVGIRQSGCHPCR